MSLAIFVSNYLIVKFDIAQGVTSRGNFYAYNSITVFIQSICIFCFFMKLSEREWHSKVINWISHNALAGYLISAHPLLIFALWTDVFRMEQLWDRPALYVIVAMVLSLAVFICCVLIDKGTDVLFKVSRIDKLCVRAEGRIWAPDRSH